MSSLSISQKLKQQWKRHSLWRLSILVMAMIWLTVASALLIIYQLSIQPLVQSQHQLISQHVEQIQAAAKFNENANVESWAESSVSENILTVVKTPEGIVHGVLTHIPTGLPSCSNIEPFAVLREGEYGLSILDGCVFTIDNYQVLIATNSEYIRELQDNFIHAAMVIMLMSFFIALIPGWMVRRKISEQLNAINYVATQIEQGDFSSRLNIKLTDKHNKEQNEWERIGIFINLMLDEVESSIAQIQGVTDAIAHDLRTPLTRIKNTLTLAQSETNLAIKADLLNKLHDNLDDILVTFNAMLELSKLEVQRDKSHFEKLDIAIIAQDVAELIEPILEDKAQKLVVNLQPCLVFGEPSLLFRMLYNLIDNAHKYSFENATISMNVFTNEIVIMDTGPGIAPELHSKVFQRLYRVDNSRNTPGHGLGLPLVAAIAKLHQADIALDYSDLDEKTGLKVTLRFASSTQD